MNNEKFEFFGSIVNFINIEILEHGYLNGDSEWNFHGINSPFNRLYFVMDGHGSVYNNNEKTDLLPGNVYLIPCDHTYSYCCTSHLVKFYIHFKIEILPGNDLFNNINSCLSRIIDTNTINTLVKKAKSSNINDITWCKAFFLDVISNFIEPYENNMEKLVSAMIKYQSIFDLLKNTRPANVTVKQLAPVVGMSVSSLSKSFRQDTGITLKDFINNHIIQTSKEFLLLDNSSIKQVAYALGYTDEFYFSRFFKKRTGLSPKEYRKQNRMEYNY